jgi:hypothetical protein
MRVRNQAAIVGIHSVTSANALHYAYNSASSPASRFLLTLQAAGWMVQFRKWAESREESLQALSITDLKPHDESAEPDAILSRPVSEADTAASEILALARDLPSRQKLLAGALRVTIPRADEVHYYKYLAALIEDIPLVSPEWQPHLTAASVYYMKRPGDAEPEPIIRARKAIRTLAV